MRLPECPLAFLRLLSPSGALAGLFLVLFPVGEAAAQAKSPTEGFTPLAMTAGSPAGSFALSGFENVNLFNGNLSFHLPLLHIGGRGEAGYTMTLDIERRMGFRFSHTTGDHDLRGVYIPQWDWFELQPGFSPGVISARKATQEVSGGEETALTRLTFRTADGTEYEFRDTVYGGRAVRAPSDHNSGTRGRTFVASEGSGARFVADQEIRDQQPGSSLAGWLYLRSGTRYQTDPAGRVTKIIDRNGNTTVLDYAGRDVSTITDSLGRVVTINTESDNAGKLQEIIRYRGFRGAPREIRVRYDDLENHLREPSVCEGGGACLCSELFPTINFDEFNGLCNPRVVASVELPNTDAQHPEQATHYDFSYNQYGELAKVEIPTGGSFTYDWEAGPGTVGSVLALPFDSSGSRTYSSVLYRRVKRRQVHDYDNPVQWTDYSQCASEGAFSCFRATQVDPATGGVLGREDHYFYGGPTDSYVKAPCDYPDPYNGREAYSRTYDRDDQDWKRQISQDWEEGAGVPCMPGNDCSLHLAANLRLRRVINQLDDRQQSKVEYEYDEFNNVTSKKEFDYGAQDPTRTTVTSYMRAQFISANLLSLPSVETVYDGAGMASQTTFGYDETGLVERPGIVGWTAYTAPRGNPTTTRRYAGPSEPDVVTEMAYDMAGNVVTVKDPLGRATHLAYDDDFGIPNGRVQERPGLNTFAFPTSVKQPPVNRVHLTRTQYDYYTGLVVDQADENGTVTSFYHDDPLERLTLVAKAANSGNASYRTQTGFRYRDGRHFREVHIHSDKDQVGDGNIYQVTKYDQLGRQTHHWTEDAERTGFVEVRTSYDARGRAEAVSNPHNEDPVNGEAEHLVWTRTAYDILDRPLRVSAPDGAVTTMSYYGNQATVTDPANKTRSSVTDAFGRVVSVTEDSLDGHPVTGYSYDVFDRLTRVKQGDQIRTFTYDPLGRLRRADNHESGLTRYEYDAAGNLTKRTDARNVVTTTEYDDLNRPKHRTYNDGTPEVTFTYDADALPGTFPVGRLTGVTNGLSAAAYHYDPLGRVSASAQTIEGITYAFAYAYDRQGNLTKERYPSGKLLTTTRDGQQRVTSVRSEEQMYSSGYLYKSHAAPIRLQLGNNLLERTDFNDREQPTLARLGFAAAVEVVDLLSLAYEYWPSGAPTQNNGNVHLQTITVWEPATTPGTAPITVAMTQAYSYDGANRLQTARETAQGAETWSQTYGYDRFGNRAVVAGYVPQTAVTPRTLGDFDPLTNRLLLGNMYDPAGNQTYSIGRVTGRANTYDAENRMVTTNTGATTYQYDGEGRRVMKRSGDKTVYIYDALGRLAAEYGPANSVAFVGTHYLTQDPLGSTRVVTDDAARIVGRHDFLPFGEDIPQTVGPRSLVDSYKGLDGARQRFTGKERDFETGLDYFGARYFSGAQGRFISADGLLSSGYSANPQSWNRYAYTYSNPLKYVDPTGQAPCCAEEALDFVDGTIRGAAATISMGTMPGSTPESEDSLVNLSGQALGTLAIAGTEIVIGSGAAVVTSPASVTGVGVAAPAIGVAVAATGAISGTINMAKINKELGEPGGPKVGSDGAPGEGKRFSEKTKDAARAESPNCVFCDKPTTREPGPRQSNIDHAKAKSRRGNNTRQNAQNTCRSCNLWKGTMSTDEFLRYLESLGRP